MSDDLGARKESVWCDGCGVEVTWAPVRAGERYDCCQDCRDGLQCDCRQRQELDADERSTPR